LIAATGNASDIHLMISSRFVLDFIFFVIEKFIPELKRGEASIRRLECKGKEGW